jgi:GNAT superfamily N-acetyltransferase
MRIARVSGRRTRRLPRFATRDSIHLRCLAPADSDQVTDLLSRMSPRSRYQRYFRLVRSFPPSVIARFVATGPDHLAVGAFDGELLVGTAQYFRSSTCSDQAEVAVEVADSHHRRGVGARLVGELARVAADHGITHLTATVLADNRPALALVRASGWDVVATADGPYVDFVVSLPPVHVDAGTTRSRPRSA